MFRISAHVCPCAHLLMHRCSNSNRRTIGTLSITITVISNHCRCCLSSLKVLITSVHSVAIEHCPTGHGDSCPFSLPPSLFRLLECESLLSCDSYEVCLIASRSAAALVPFCQAAFVYVYYRVRSLLQIVIR